MMRGSISIWILLTCAINVAYGLDCYQCLYGDGLPGSKEDCKKKGTDLSSCSGRSEGPTSSDGTAISGHLATYRDPNIQQADTIMCGKGEQTYRGIDVIVRGCALGNATHDGKCGLTEYVWEVRLSNGTSINLNNAKSCLCSKNKCNSAGFLKPSLVGVGSLLVIGGALLNQFV